MCQKCVNCKKEYIEENEELCIECAVLFAAENESTSKYFDEINVDEVDGETLHNLSVSLREQDC